MGFGGIMMGTPSMLLESDSLAESAIPDLEKMTPDIGACVQRGVSGAQINAGEWF